MPQLGRMPHEALPSPALHCHAVQALRVLDNVMDTIIDQPVNPPPPWSLLERCAAPV